MKNTIQKLMVVLSVLALPLCMNAQVTTTYPGTGGGGAVTDGTPLVVTVNVVSAEDQINDVDLGLDITHTWIGDMEITLESPAGTVVTLRDNYNGNVDNLVGTYDDESANAEDGGTTDISPNAGTSVADLQPLNALSVFDGEDPNGTWTMTITDTVGGDDGTLNSWDLVVTATAAVVLTVPTLGEWGLIIFSLLLLNLAVFYVVKRKRKSSLAGA